jgi:hypothetical protein
MLFKIKETAAAAARRALSFADAAACIVVCRHLDSIMRGEIECMRVSYIASMATRACGPVLHLISLYDSTFIY